MGSWVRLGRGFSLYLLYRNRYFFCRTFNVHEVLSMLEDVGEFEEASIYIEPSPVAAITDEDSADEDEGGTYSNLNWNQLLAGSCVSVLMQGVSTYLQQIKVSQKGMEHHQRMEEIWFKNAHTKSNSNGIASQLIHHGCRSLKLSYMESSLTMIFWRWLLNTVTCMLIQRETLNFQLFLMNCVHLMLSYLFQATAQHLVERCTGFTTRTCTMKL